MQQPWEIELLKYYVANVREWNRALKYFKSLLEVRLASEFGDIVEIRGRVKTFESSVEKVARRRYLTGVKEEEHLTELKRKITDFIGLRVVCFFSEDIERIVEVLKRHFYVRGETNKIEELEVSESIFGYRAYHLDLTLLDDGVGSAEYRRYGTTSFEVQVRTIVQEAWTILQNKLVYKKNVSRAARLKISALAAIFETIDEEYIGLRDQIRVDEQVTTALSDVKGDEVELLAEVTRLFNGQQVLPTVWQRLMFDLDRLLPDWDVRQVATLLEQQGKKLEPFFRAHPHYDERPGEKIRLLLYASNPVTFKPIIPIASRQIFDLWRSGVRAEI